MGLDVSKLKNVKKGPSGGVRAGCPACAAKGEDKREEHLFIRKDGRFGCAKYPKDKAHRSAIAKQVGLPSAQPRSLIVPIKPLRTPKTTIRRSFGTDGTPFSNLRAYAENINIHTDNVCNEIGAGVKDFEKAVPNVPELDKSLMDSESEERWVAPTWMQAEIRSWGWLDAAVRELDARLVGASWDGELHGDWRIAK
jgi:hypothetical protein